MRLIPVLDVLNGVAVRGVGGRRNEYRPLVTQLCEGCDPLAIAAAYRRRIRTTTLYLADLDAIIDQRPNHGLYQTLLSQEFDLWLDAGLRTPDDITQLIDTGVSTVIIGLETWPSPQVLPEVTTDIGAERLLFSLDLRHGRPCGGSEWSDQPLQIIDNVLAAGIHRFLVLDLHDVGQHTGGSTAEHCRAIRQRAPHAEIITGGGIRDADDVRRWEAEAVDGLLVASAIHDGRLQGDITA